MRSICDRRDEAWPLFLRAYTVLLDRLEHELQTERNLPLTWFDVLAQLEGAPGGRMRMNDLAGSILLSKSGLTRLVDRMARAGLVERAACDTDRRVVYAAITDAGRRAFEKAAPVAVRGVEEHFTAPMTPAEKRALVSALQKILDAATARSEERAAG
ncbi:MAG: MarR family winged helix-turn-helix transcriptional regulator [Actinomycetota bacterium]